MGSSSGQSDRSESANRVCHIIESLYSGNCSKLAAAIDCSPSLLTRIVKGEREPGRNLLEKIGHVPKVNRAWLLSGIGEPFLETTDHAELAGVVLPIARILFDGEPAANEPCLSGDVSPVAAATYRPSRYYLRFDRIAGQLADELRLVPGDLIMMDSAASCRKTIAHVLGRVCIYRDLPSNTLQLGFAEEDLSPEDSTYPIFVTRLDVQHNAAEAQHKKRSPRRSIREPLSWTNIGLNDVVAVALQLVRRFDLSGTVTLKRRRNKNVK